ncbi:hypothetical protein C5B85_10870 [Pseudoclavibacter sp. AY1F1]|nr:hypothetical protein C5B85_10870 [Pseudoclavibacter sp. AY1F1]
MSTQTAEPRIGAQVAQLECRLDGPEVAQEHLVHALLRRRALDEQAGLRARLPRIPSSLFSRELGGCISSLLRRCDHHYGSPVFDPFLGLIVVEAATVGSDDLPEVAVLVDRDPGDHGVEREHVAPGGDPTGRVRRAVLRGRGLQHLHAGGGNHPGLRVALPAAAVGLENRDERGAILRVGEGVAGLTEVLDADCGREGFGHANAALCREGWGEEGASG